MKWTLAGGVTTDYSKAQAIEPKLNNRIRPDRQKRRAAEMNTNCNGWVMKYLETLFLSRYAYINGQLSKGEDLVEFAKHLKERRVLVIAQRAVILNGKTKSLYIETN